MPGTVRSTPTISSPLASSVLQIVAIDLDGQLALDAADGFFHVVGDGLREIPERAGDLAERAIHGGDQRFLVLAEDGAPLFLVASGRRSIRY